MLRKQKNKIRAFILLMVFSLNTIAGFACSIGVDMGYNTKHHEHPQSDHAAKHSHSHTHKHNRHHKHVTGAKLKEAKDDCCSNQVNDFNKLEKAIPYNGFLLLAPSFEISTAIFSLVATNAEVVQKVNSRFQFVRRSCFLNDTDLLTAISRFRI